VEYAIIVLVVLVALAVVLARGKKSAKHGESGGFDFSVFSPKRYFFTRSERALFESLQDVLPEGHWVFPKVRLADLVDIDAKRGEYMSAFGRVSQKHLDFVVFDNDLNLRVVVELDGKSHQRARQQESDRAKEQVLAAIGLELIRFKVGHKWDLSRVREAVGAVGPNEVAGG